MPKTVDFKISSRWIWIIIGMLALQPVGCIEVSKESWVISKRGLLETRQQSGECTTTCLDQNGDGRFNVFMATPSVPARKPELNSAGFSLVSWNMFKGRKDGWADDLQKFIQNSDILVLQEAYLSESLKRLLNQGKYNWDMTAAFEYRDINTGVLTASRTTPTFTCGLRQIEPITRIPKGVLVTRYPMSGTNQQLLVVNIHAINFTVGSTTFEQQSKRLENILTAHHGPLIVSGDFNTWNADRMAHVNAMAENLGLAAVKFDENRRFEIFGQNVDHIYYRGLETVASATPVVSTSDHNPLTVVFKLADETNPET
jgi:endonuclease/exonuclease/phosphatase (EEP) superfamily protein YafD